MHKKSRGLHVHTSTRAHVNTCSLSLTCVVRRRYPQGTLVRTEEMLPACVPACRSACSKAIDSYDVEQRRVGWMGGRAHATLGTPTRVASCHIT